MFIRIICTAAVLILPAAISAGMIDFYLKWDDHSENITDISYLNHKPAGVSGPVAAVNGHTYINSETERIKFFAVNVTSSSCFPEKSYAPIIAKRMAKFGVNLARFHLADTWQWGESIFDYSGTGGTRTIDWSPGGTGDRMEYFIKCLIDEGIYINMNLLAGRSFTSADGLPASIDDMDWKDKQTPAMYYTEMINLQKEYASGLLSHVNPYTGRAMKDEPAVAFVEICNEHGLIHAWYNRQMDDDRLAAEFKTDLQAKWNTYLQGAYADHAALRSAWEISQPPGPEMLLNPDFASGTSLWTFQEFAPADGTAAAEIDGHSPGLNAVHVTVTAAGSENWHIQLYQEGLDFTAGVPYTISFSAKADTDRDILMIIEQAEDPWMPMGVSKVLNLTDQWQRFEFTVMVSFSESNARLNFREMADEPGVYSFADVSCRQGGSIGLKSGEDLD
ncbi:MAG: carbohydrate binding domain-containing protein, partial [bacterium]